MEDNLKIVKVEYLSNHWLDFPQSWNLSSGDQPEFKEEEKIWPLMEYDLYWKTTPNGRRPLTEDNF